MRSVFPVRHPRFGNIFYHSLIPFLFFFSLFQTNNLSAQNKERKLVREGNQLFKEKKYTDAEVKYKKSLEQNANSVPGNYNLGNAYYRQGKFDEASKQYQSAITGKEISELQKANSLHNIGNSLLQEKKYSESIESYKQALKLNPKDNDTRYNLAYAQSMLQQQQQQQQQNKDDKNKDQQNKDQQNQQQQKQEQKKDDQEQEKQAREQKKNISKEDAEKILQALNNDEKNAQKRLQKKDAVKYQTDKRW